MFNLNSYFEINSKTKCTSRNLKRKYVFLHYLINMHSKSKLKNCICYHWVARLFGYSSIVMKTKQKQKKKKRERLETLSIARKKKRKKILK